MGKPVDRAYEWTVEELAAVVKRLTVAAEVFEDFRQIAEESPTKTLASHNRLTFLRAMTNLDSGKTAGASREEGGDDVKSSWPLYLVLS